MHQDASDGDLCGVLVRRGTVHEVKCKGIAEEQEILPSKTFENISSLVVTRLRQLRCHHHHPSSVSKGQIARILFKVNPLLWMGPIGIGNATIIEFALIDSASFFARSPSPFVSDKHRIEL